MLGLGLGLDIRQGLGQGLDLGQGLEQGQGLRLGLGLRIYQLSSLGSSSVLSDSLVMRGVVCFGCFYQLGLADWFPRIMVRGYGVRVRIRNRVRDWVIEIALPCGVDLGIGLFRQLWGGSTSSRLLGLGLGLGLG